jgi:hypothetical protein
VFDEIHSQPFYFIHALKDKLAMSLMIQSEVAFKIEKLAYVQCANVIQVFSNISYVSEEIQFFPFLFKHSTLTVPRTDVP